MKPFLPVPNPVAITVFGVNIMWYAVMITLGMILGGIVLCGRVKTRGFTVDQATDYILYIVPAAVIGARLYYVIFEPQYYAGNLLKIFDIRSGGLAIHGAIIATAIMLLIIARVKKHNFFDMTDLAFPCIALGQAIGRWGNYFNSEAHGTPTDLPWHILADGELVHPTFLYESIWCLLLFVFLSLLDKRNLKNKTGFKGQITCLYLILYSVERFFVEGLRTDSLYLDAARTIRQAQVLSGALVIVGIAAYFILKKKALPLSNEKPETEEDLCAEENPAPETESNSQNTQ